MEGVFPFLSVCAWSFWLPNRCLILQQCTWHLGQMSCKMTPFWDGVRRNNRKKNYFNSCVLSKSQSCWLWRMWRYMYIHKIYHNLNTPKCNPTCNSGGIFNVRLLNWFAAVVFAVRVSVSACPLVFLVSSFSFFIPLQINKKKNCMGFTHTHTHIHTGNNREQPLKMAANAITKMAARSFPLCLRWFSLVWTNSSSFVWGQQQQQQWSNCNCLTLLTCVAVYRQPLFSLHPKNPPPPPPPRIFPHFPLARPHRKCFWCAQWNMQIFVHIHFEIHSNRHSTAIHFLIPFHFVGHSPFERLIKCWLATIPTFAPLWCKLNSYCATSDTQLSTATQSEQYFSFHLMRQYSQLKGNFFCVPSSTLALQLSEQTNGIKSEIKTLESFCWK